jgi:hypothetical protein
LSLAQEERRTSVVGLTICQSVAFDLTFICDIPPPTKPVTLRICSRSHVHQARTPTYLISEPHDASNALGVAAALSIALRLSDFTINENAKRIEIGTSPDIWSYSVVRGTTILAHSRPV